jgi:hypothetical protein
LFVSSRKFVKPNFFGAYPGSEVSFGAVADGVDVRASSERFRHAFSESEGRGVVSHSAASDAVARLALVFRPKFQSATSADKDRHESSLVIFGNVYPGKTFARFQLSTALPVRPNISATKSAPPSAEITCSVVLSSVSMPPYNPNILGAQYPKGLVS